MKIKLNWKKITKIIVLYLLVGVAVQLVFVTWGLLVFEPQVRWGFFNGWVRDVIANPVWTIITIVIWPVMLLTMINGMIYGFPD